MEVYKILENKLSSATALNIACIKLFGVQYLNWEPETLKMELKEIVPSINYDKIQAISTLLTTQYFYTYWEGFEKIGNALNMNDPYFQTLAPLDPYEICWAIVEAKINDDDDEKYSEEVQAYIKVSLKNNGYPRTPKIIKDMGICKDYNEGDIDETDLDKYIQTRIQKIKEEVS